MSSIITRPAVDPVHIDLCEVDCTIKVIASESAAITDVLMMVRAQGVAPEKIVGIYRGQPSDPAFYVKFGEKEVVDLMRSKDKLVYRNVNFKMIALGAQVVSLRVHWLPLYFNDSLLKSVFSDFGRVVDIEHSSTHGLKNGVRVVRLEIDEVGRMSLPHMVKFGCGTTMLITMAGRPPLCLKCQSVGHVRRDCPMNFRSYSKVVRDDQSAQDPPNEKETEQSVSQEQQQPPQEPEQPMQQQQPPLDSSSDPNMGIVSLNSVTGDNDANNADDDDAFMEVNKPSLKRNLGEEVVDSFNALFPPQKIVKSTKLETSNRFQALEDLSTLLEDV